jgi:hypothetical protein
MTSVAQWIELPTLIGRLWVQIKGSQIKKNYYGIGVCYLTSKELDRYLSIKTYLTQRMGNTQLGFCRNN